MSFKYYKHKCGEYYRVYPDDHYEYFPFYGEQQGWHPGISSTWTHRLSEVFLITKPLEVSELEVLVVLGPEAVREVRQ